jgi:excinuclease ABC subunit A
MNAARGRIVVRGARQHNLKNIDVVLPRDALVVITGPSGSGKSSLAFDTILAEGQRRYVDTLAVGARRAFDQMPRPDVDAIEGLSPTISVQQRGYLSHPRATVGTASEAHDFLRLLFARAGEPHCPRCGEPVRAHTVQAIVDRGLALPEGTLLRVEAPLLRGATAAAVRHALDALRKEGFVRVVIDGASVELDAALPLARGRSHDLQVDVDRLRVKPGIRQRLTESVELALRIGHGVVILRSDAGEPARMSDRNGCAVCGYDVGVLAPRRFSFNDPHGACPACKGLGVRRRVEPDRVVPDPSRSLRAGAVAAWGSAEGAYYALMLQRLVAALGVDADRPWGELPPEVQKRVLHGEREERARGYPGVIPVIQGYLERASDDAGEDDGPEADAAAAFYAEAWEDLLVEHRCSECDGTRLHPVARRVILAGTSIDRVVATTLAEALAWVTAVTVSPDRVAVAAPILADLRRRMEKLVELGLDYLSLDRPMRTLSAGEAARVQLANHLGASLVGVTYVLDEPSTGLHPRDTARLLSTLRDLRERGNSVLVVEHDLDAVRAADHVVEIGPGAGDAGGEVVASGTAADLIANPRSPTGRCLLRRVSAPREKPARPHAHWIEIANARAHNLAGIDVRIPVAALTCVTGVSGSGKSSLVMDTLLPAARARVRGTRAHRVSARVTGVERFRRVVNVDQRPIGRTPRSTPATYTGMFTGIRELFAEAREARARGYGPARFSFNVKGGRCETCRGAGVSRVEMDFLPDVYVTCSDCEGRRYNRETLEVHHRGVDIAGVLDLGVDAAREAFAALPRVSEMLDSLRAVGLGYLRLGQSATTLSAGEAQRLRLARELASQRTGETLYVLDEPTSGLHASDVEVLLGVLRGLVERGDTVVVVEHDLDVVRAADHVIDLGPEGGPGGGRVVAVGTPAEIVAVAASHTGRHLGGVC